MKLWMAVAGMFIFPASLLAVNQRAQGWCEQGGQNVVINPGISSTTKVQASYPRCTVTVYLSGTSTIATLFSNTTGTPLANPFSADVLGHWFFYAANGHYDVTISGGGLSAPYTFGDILLGGSADSVSITNYGAVCDGLTDDYAAIQATLDANPGATVTFPSGSTCVSSGTWILSDSTGRNFIGRMYGNGATIQWTNDGVVTDTDATMKHGIGAYNRINDPANGQSETAGVTNTEIAGFKFFGPNYGAIMFFGNSRHIWIHDNYFSGKQASFTSTTNPRHGIVIDCGINPIIEHNYFSTPTSTGTTPNNFLVAAISIIKSGDTSTGHVVYTNFPPFSGYFNDSPVIQKNNIDAAAAFAILDQGTGSFTNRDIADNYGSGGAKGWFYASSTGVSSTIKNNWCETCAYGIGTFNNAIGGNIPGTSIPHSYFPSVPGGPEHFVIDANEFANLTGGVFYSESSDASRTVVTRNRLNNVTAGVTFWLYLASTSNVVDFRDDNLVVYSSSTYPAQSRAINPSIVSLFTGPFGPPFTASAYLSGRSQASCQLYAVSITSGGHWLVNGVDSGVGPLAQTFQFIYFADSLPSNSIITGITMKTSIAFTASGLTSMTATVGDGVGAGPPAANETWYAAALYDVHASVSNTNHGDYVAFKAPQDESVGHTFVSFRANQNLSIGSLTGSLNINLCWAVMQ